MSRNNTGNPIDSMAFPDFQDNVKNLDQAVNSEELSWRDRFGRDRKSFEGMEQEFDADQSRRESEFDADQAARNSAFESAQDSREERFNDFIASSGYQFAGDYGPGIEITEYNQLIRDSNGEFWRLSGQVELPYTTTGAGIPEDDALVPAGDAVLRQELADPAQGGDLVQVTTSTGEQTLAGALDDRVNTQDIIQPVATFDSVSDMVMDENLSIGDKAKTLGYYEPGDGGGNNYEIVASATGTDDGGSFIDLVGSGLQAKGLFGSEIICSQFGIAGDGISDDTQQINNMFLYIQSQDGGRVRFPSGRYRLTDIVSFGRNLTWINDKNAVFVREHTFDMFRNDLDVTESTSGRGAGNNNISIEGGVFDGNSLGDFYEGFNCFEIGYARNVTIKNITVLDVVNAHAVDLSACEQVVFDGCRFLGFSDATSGGDRDFSEAIQLDPNLPGSFNGGALDGAHCHDVTVVNCYFGKNPNHDDPRFQPWPTGVGNHFTAHDEFVENVVISNNIFDGMTYACVRPFKWLNVTIAGNSFVNLPNTCDAVKIGTVAEFMASSSFPDGTPSGLPQGASGLTISSNIFEGGRSGVEIIGRVKSDGSGGIIYGTQNNVSITGNTFSGLSGDAVRMTWAKSVSIASNTANSVNRLMFTRNCNEVTVSGNSANSIGAEGIYSEIFATEDVSASEIQNAGDNRGYSIQSNYIRDCQRWGISLQNARFSSVSNNTVINPSQESLTRGAIQAGAGANDCFIFSNFALMDGGVEPNEGIVATPSTTRVVMGANYTTIGSGAINNSVSGLSLDAGYV